MNFFNSDSAPDRDVWSLNKGYYTEMQYFLRTNQTVKQCKEVLSNFLLSNIELKRAVPRLEEYVSEFFKPFFRAVLREVILTGWCSYTIRKMKGCDGKTFMVPVVIPSEYICPEVCLDKKTFTYEIYAFDHNGVELRSDVKFLLFTDISNLANPNMIGSVLDGLIVEHRFSEQIRRFTVQAEFVRSNPTIYLSRERAGNGQGDLGVQNGAFDRAGRGMDRTTSVTVREAAMGRIDSGVAVNEMASKDMAANMEYHAAQMRGMASSHSTNYYNSGLGYAPQYWNNTFVCPPNMVLAAPPSMPVSRVDQLTIDRALSSKIYQAFGIPESLMGSVGGMSAATQGTSSRSDKMRKEVNFMDLVCFDATIERFRKFFEETFLIVYEDIFAVNLPREVIDFKEPEMYTKFVLSALADMKEIKTKSNKRGIEYDDSDSDSAQEQEQEQNQVQAQEQEQEQEQEQKQKQVPGKRRAKSTKRAT